MKKSVYAGILISTCLAIGIASPVQAKSDKRCTDTPKSQWLAKDQLKSKAEQLGYEVYKIEFDDRCAEIKGTDKNGAKIEIKLNPATGDVVPYRNRK